VIESERRLSYQLIMQARKLENSAGFLGKLTCYSLTGNHPEAV